ncbi:sugar ABC transporter ATP-binding protein (plasmid) [Rhizobium etli 8C-3]|uniref:Carbohydrate ABC transporter ATP-binding protein (CUT1 family) n=2 Tax=Rhizobium TaxID=379 RepID=A0A4R3S0X4_9HYPH|nr:MULTISPECIES: sn-glycerol-3-phosphate ABC transporter ATP-binding protein UgpC [Rhizobium]APO79880.1 sugar ABC transporter ATP-binding protein [Rhizobium etli 8C-3]TCU30675.1 carbohydrate ABC transporter ATP-binding protein (CUT1 family) [Rhizobium azibense]TCU41314.1 carbohydrate ABC transporter ATP-binding protein (CUT1 family) [Rhizobium azibense]
MANLVLENVNKSFGTLQVIPDINLDIRDGEFVVFVGPSGCGKSTLLRMIAGLEEATGGDIRINGESVIDTPAADRGVAMVFQSYALYPHMTVRQNLSFGLENIRMPKDEIDRRVEAAGKLLQIDTLLDRRPRQLSGGQRQRVAIGRAITRDPKIFLFDEPLSNLDAELRVLMRVEITKLHERLGNTMIYVTHDQIEAMTMADKIVVLRKGVIEQVGAPLDLYNRPHNTFVAGFIGSPRMNLVEGTIGTSTNGTLAFEGAGLPPLELPLEAGLAGIRKATLGVRPEDLLVGESGWPAEVAVAEQHGANSYLHCILLNGEPILVHQQGQSRVARGDVLNIAPRAGHWHLFDETGLRIKID